MGIFDKIKSWFFPSKLAKPAQAKPETSPRSSAGKPVAPKPNAGPGVATLERPRPTKSEKPVAIDLHTEDDPDKDLEGFDPTPAAIGSNGSDSLPVPKPPRSRQELISELQKNYQEVLSIVRKVDTHLDEQGQRSRRMAEIAERFPAAADDLSHVRAQHDAVHEALESVALTLRERDTNLTQGQAQAIERLEEIRGLMAESSQAERELVGSLVEFRDTMGGVTAATGKLTEAVERIENKEKERTEEIVDAIRSIKSSVTAVGIVATSVAVIALVAGFAALMLG